MKTLLISIWLFSFFTFAQNKYAPIYECSMLKSAANTGITSSTLYPGDTSYDVIYYKLNLTLSWRPDYLVGEVTVTAESMVNNLTSVFIDLVNVLTVDSVLMDGVKLNFIHENDIITAELSNAVNLNELFSLIVYYKGIPSAPAGRGLTFGEVNGSPAIYSLSQPYGVKHWWPCKDTPGDKADSADIWLTVSNGLTAVSNGNLTEVTDNGETKTFKWKHSYPVSHYLISAAVAEYTLYTQTFEYNNYLMPVTHFIYPAKLESVKEELDKTIDMLYVFSGLFGDYPFLKEKYGHAEFGWGGGMEHQTISSMGVFNELIISHELAHQWYGDMITCRDWHHIWLNEGFATYATGLYFEAAYGQASYAGYINTQVAAAKTAVGSLFVEDITNVPSMFNGARTYSKGAVVLHMLRGITGDSLFFNILRAYSAHPSVAYGTAVTEDFQLIAEGIYGGSLDYFFKEWIYGENFPKYRVSWNQIPSDGENHKIELRVEQQKNTSPSFFTMPLKILIKTDNGDTVVTVFNNSIEQLFEFMVNGKPYDLIVDPDNYIMKEIIYTSPANTHMPSDYILHQNYPNPFNSSTVIKFSLPAGLRGEKKTELLLYDITGREISKLFSGYLNAGTHSIRFNISDLPAGLSSGIYIYKLKSEGVIRSRKMTHLK